MTEAVRSDLVHVLAALESHFLALENEIRQLNTDIIATEQLLRRYGELYRLSLQHLRQLKKSKKASMREILLNLENLNDNLDGGRRLLKSLATTAQPSVPVSLHTNQFSRLDDAGQTARRASSSRGIHSRG